MIRERDGYFLKDLHLERQIDQAHPKALVEVDQSICISLAARQDHWAPVQHLGELQ